MKFGLEAAWSVLGLLVTAFATVMLVRDLGGLMRRSFALHEAGVFATQVVFTTIFLFLIYGNALYQFARLGYLMRLRRHRRRLRGALDAVYDEASPPTVCMLIPSYKEEPAVVRQAVLSCALQDWPERRVVLLIDDPYDPPAAADREALERMRRMPVDVAALLGAPAAWCREASGQFEAELRSGTQADERALSALEALLDRVAGWFEDQGACESRQTHTDRLFVALTFHERARAERQRREALREELADLTPSAATSRLRREYRRLARLFEVEITSFQRKRYVNLSDEPNKAMNLNSYIGLMGGTYRETELQGSPALVPAEPGEEGLRIADAEFLLTLDADSLLAPDYALRLLDVARAPGNERVAVIQTPYSSVPGAPGVLERVAGATTDL